MAWFALYILYSLLSLLLTAFDLFYRTTLLVFPCSYGVPRKALLNGRVCGNSLKRVTEISEKEGGKCKTCLTLKKKYLGNVDYGCEKFFKGKEYQQCGTEQVGKASYMSGTEGMETHPRLKKGWFTYDFIAWRWNGGSDRSGELGSYKKALTEIQKREEQLGKREAVLASREKITGYWILFGIILRYMIISKMSSASNSPIKETKRMSADICDLMGYKGSVQKEEGRQDVGIGTPAESTPKNNITSGQPGILVPVGDSWWQYAMPVPKMPGVPMFQEKDVTEFIEMMESLFWRHHVVANKDKLTYLPDYCQSTISMWIRSLDEYKTGKYEEVVEKLKDQYAAKDKTQKIFNIY